MKKRSQKTRQAGNTRLRAILSAWMALILCVVMLPGMAPAARAADKTSSLTIQVPPNLVEDYEDLSQVTLQLYKIGEQKGDSWVLDSVFESVQGMLSSEPKAKEIEAATAALEAIIDAGGSGVPKPVPTGKMSKDGTVSYPELEPGYYLIRKEVPEHANLESTASKEFRMTPFLITLITTVSYTVEATKITKNSTELRNVSVYKSWKDGGNHRPESIQVKLLENGELCYQTGITNPVTLNAANGWEYVWKDLYLYDTDGETELEYTVEELIDGDWHQYYDDPEYTYSKVVVDGNTTIGYTIKNPQKTGSLNIEKSVTVDNKKPSGDLAKLADGTYKFTVEGVDVNYPASQVSLTIQNGKSVKTSLPGLYCGQYKITEEEPKNGVTLVGPNGIIVEVKADKDAKVPTASFVNNAPTPTPPPSTPPTTNPPGGRTNPPGGGTTPPPSQTTPPPGEPTPTPAPTTELNGQKIWRDDNNVHGLRPENITIELLANGVVVSSTPIWRSQTGNTWSFSFIDLPALDSEGNPINYTVRELPVDGYNTTVEGNTVINELIPRTPNEYINISGVKVWNDGNNALGRRPNYITIRLLRDGQDIGEQRTVTAANEWQYAFQNLPQDDGYGHVYTYTLREDTVSGYFARISGYNITNTQLPETIDENETPLGAQSEEELEGLLDLFDYGTPLFGELLQTGDETPMYPYIFGGIGALAILILLVAGRRRRREE